jgi:anaerobic selenocysteine-containing dehydrogenase
MLTAALLAGPYGLRRLPRRPLTVAALLARHPEGRDLGPLIPMLRRRRVRVRAVPAQLETEIRRLDESVAAQASQPRDTLLLIGRRRRRALNSWSEDRPATSPAAGTALLINPADAAARGIADGARVRIRARAGSLVASAALSPDMMTGVVSLPHGCRVQQLPDGRPAGPDRGAGLNDLTDELALDAVSGTAAFTATPVRIEPER